MEDMADKLSEIGHDTDAIIKMIGGQEMGESYTDGLINGMIQNGGGLGGNNGLMWLLFLLILGRNGGIGGASMEDVAKNSTVINEANYTRLLDAIGSQGEAQQRAISDLASVLNCDVTAINSALAGLDKSLALSNGDIKSAISTCCCNVRQAISDRAAEITQGQQETRFLITAQGAAQDASINKQFCDLKTEMNAQFTDIKIREDAREIESLRVQLADAKARANKNEILAAIASRDTVSGTLNTTAGTWAGSIS